MKELIINTPSMQSLWQSYSSVLITFIFWLLWFFLWVPVATAIAWYSGLHLAYFEMFEMDGFKSVIDDFLGFLQIVALLGGSLAIWASYNFLRFRGNERRKPQKPVEIEQVADYFDLDVETLKQRRKEKMITVNFDDKGKIIGIDKLVPIYK